MYSLHYVNVIKKIFRVFTLGNWNTEKKKNDFRMKNVFLLLGGDWKVRGSNV